DPVVSTGIRRSQEAISKQPGLPWRQWCGPPCPRNPPAPRARRPAPLRNPRPKPALEIVKIVSKRFGGGPSYFTETNVKAGRRAGGGLPGGKDPPATLRWRSARLFQKQPSHEPTQIPNTHAVPPEHCWLQAPQL